MAVDGCGLVCKYILFIFNIIFALVGLVLLGLGLWLRFSPGTRGIFEIEALNSSVFVMVVTIMIVLGSVILIVVSFGDYGACGEKRCALQVFSVLLAFLFVAEVAVAVLAYTKRDQVQMNIVEFYTSLYALYVSSGGDPVIGVTLTFIHKTLHCCGVTGVSLIEIAKNTCPDPKGFSDYFIMKNCPVTIAEVFDSRGPMMMGILFGIGVLLITAMVCTSILWKQLKKVHQEVTAYYKNVY
uniref:CD9 antigen isoform X2 n=1 Tax=Scatophagus argus TaxID=75038 RepID=UPI001ED8433E|nr:CD9 antigen isoform X2 [Scatophagus argus]